MAGKKKYFDLRYLFMRGLIQRERWQRTRHYLKSAAECTSRAVVSLELAENPVKSIAQAKQLEGIGGETKERLKEILDKKEKSSDRPSDGKFVSSAGALLVALLDLTENVEKSGTGDLALIPEAVLKCEARPLCEEMFVEESGFCQAWWRIEVLIRRGLVKRRQLNKEDVYQLMLLGREIAHRLRTERDALVEKIKPLKSPTLSKPKLKSLTTGSPSTSAAADVPPPENYLYTNDVGLDGIILEVDTQEMGGDRVGLGEHCGRLDRSGVRYRTRRLPCGDYQWVWRCEGTERTIPLLVERKRADDIAHSLKDGRFWRQVSKMVDWKAGFGKKDIIARLVYILEGDPADYVVRCGDGCQGVGLCGNPTLTQVQLAMKDLEEHPELEIRRTNCTESTIQYLAIVTEEIGKRADKGEYDMLIVSEMIEDKSEDQKPPEVLELEDTPPDELTQDIKPGKTTKEDIFMNDINPEIRGKEQDSQENETLKASFEDLPSIVSDSEELPPLDHSPNSIAVKPATNQPYKRCVRKRTHSGSNNCSSPDKGIKARKSSSTNSKKEDNSKIEGVVDDILDIDSELSVFSSFSDYANLKRTYPEIKPDEPKRLSSPLKKIKLNFIPMSLESQTDQNQFSPRHGKVYLMKKCRKTPENRTNLTKKLDECVTSQVSSLSRSPGVSDTHHVELSPRRGDLNSSPEPGCSGIESQLCQSDTKDIVHCKQEDNDSMLKVKFPFKSSVRSVNSSTGDQYMDVHDVDPSASTKDTFEQDNASKTSFQIPETSSSDAFKSKHSDANQSFEPKQTFSNHNSFHDLDHSVNLKQGDSDTDDSLPDVGFSENILGNPAPEPVASTSGIQFNKSELGSEPVASTSGTQFNKSDLRPEPGDTPDVQLEDETRTSHQSKKSPRKYSPRGKMYQQDSDGEVTVVDSDTDYVPETNRRGRKRNSSRSGKTGRKKKPVNDSLVAQVADILPHCGQEKIRAALVKCKMNIERTVSELLDSSSQDVDVVDLT